MEPDSIFNQYGKILVLLGGKFSKILRVIVKVKGHMKAAGFADAVRHG